MKLKIKHHSDAGHGWYAVKRKLIEELGIQYEISGCSYEKGNTVYLEEDSDMRKFCKALAKKVGINPEENGWLGKLSTEYVEFSESYKDRSNIRSYKSYHPQENYNPMDDFNYVGSRHHY